MIEAAREHDLPHDVAGGVEREPHDGAPVLLAEVRAPQRDVRRPAVGRERDPACSGVRLEVRHRRSDPRAALAGELLPLPARPAARPAEVVGPARPRRASRPVPRRDRLDRSPSRRDGLSPVGTRARRGCAALSRRCAGRGRSGGPRGSSRSSRPSPCRRRTSIPIRGRGGRRRRRRRCPAGGGRSADPSAACAARAGSCRRGPGCPGARARRRRGVRRSRRARAARGTRERARAASRCPRPRRRSGRSPARRTAGRPGRTPSRSGATARSRSAEPSSPTGRGARAPVAAGRCPRSGPRTPGTLREVPPGGIVEA